MTENHREMISILVSVLIIATSIYVIQEFIFPFIWAAVIAVATWPIYLRCKKICFRNDALTSTLLITVLSTLIVMPFFWLVSITISEIHIVSRYLMQLNEHGMPMPDWLVSFPFFKEPIRNFWQDTLSKPQGLAGFISTKYHSSMQPLTEILRSVLSQLAHRGVMLVFTLLCLFFFYKDGEKLVKQINRVGESLLGSRWVLFSDNLPSAMRATVNGIVIVGIVVGVIMGLCYAIAGVPAPALLGALTAILAMIPFGVPVAFFIVTVLLLLESKIVAAIVIVSIGAVVMFVTDHFVRPMMIGGATELPFLAVFFGILGGVNTMGLVGLFIGPIIMVLFVTLWNEAS